MNGDFVAAVPGSGKTEALINKCYELMQTEGVESVVAITFTDRASEELLRRLKQRASKDGQIDLIRKLPNSNVGTIHNFCSKIVRKYGSEVGIPWYFRVMDDLESFNLLEKSVRNYVIRIRNEKKVTENGLILSRILESYETDLEQVIKECTEILVEQKGYLNYMISTKKGFHTEYNGESFDPDILKEVLSKTRISVLPDLLSLLFSFLNEYQEVKKRGRLMDFDDLLLYTLKILEVRGDEIARKFRFILVDEFQDTDELQIAIFEQLLDNGSTFFVVGDLNQSIYSFRGAHPGAQRRFSERLENHSTLKVNRRSGRNLIRFFNSYFPSIMEYEPMDGYSDQDGGVYCYIEEDKVRAVVEIVKKKIREGETPGGIAILSRTSTDFFNLNRQMRKEGVNSVLISGESVLKSQEGLDVFSLVRYLADPGDKVAQVSLLFSPFFALTPSDLVRSKERFGELLDSKLGKYREFLKKERLDMLLNRILLKEGYVSALLGSKDGREKVGRLYRILELISSHVTGYGGDPYLVAEWLQNARESKESGPIDDLLEDPSRVKIMTIHQAKGLEFNTVIIYDLRPGVDREKYYADEYSGIVAKKDKDFINSPSRRIIGKSERHNFSLNEESRIMYVAFTRAKSELHIVLSEKDLKDEKSAKKGDDLVSIFQRALGLWREKGEKERREAMERVFISPAIISTTEPLIQPDVKQDPGQARRVKEVLVDIQDDEKNEAAIMEFLKGKGDKIKEFRVNSNGARVTVSSGGIEIYEDSPVQNHYFVRNGKIEFII